jgi:hypothetical protein
VWANGFFEDAA